MHVKGSCGPRVSPSSLSPSCQGSNPEFASFRGPNLRGKRSARDKCRARSSVEYSRQFRRAVLRERGIVAFRDHPTRAHNFDNVGTVLDWFITASSICNAFLREGKLWREIVFVPVTTRYAECRPRNKHARAGHIAGIDCVTDIRVSV